MAQIAKPKKIVDVKIEDGRKYFHVKWSSSWEPEENLSSFQHLIDDFWEFVDNCRYANGLGPKPAKKRKLEPLEKEFMVQEQVPNATLQSPIQSPIQSTFPNQQFQSPKIEQLQIQQQPQIPQLPQNPQQQSPMNFSHQFDQQQNRPMLPQSPTYQNQPFIGNAVFNSPNSMNQPANIPQQQYPESPQQTRGRGTSRGRGRGRGTPSKLTYENFDTSFPNMETDIPKQQIKQQFVSPNSFNEFNMMPSNTVSSSPRGRGRGRGRGSAIGNIQKVSVKEEEGIIKSDDMISVKKKNTIPDNPETWYNPYAKIGYICRYCSKEFPVGFSKGNLKSHYESHFDIKNFGCYVCGKRCRLKGDIKTHIIRVHKEDFVEDKVIRFNDQITKPEFTPEEIKDGTAVSPYAKISFLCKICNKTLSGQRGNWKSHYESHLDIKPFGCYVCGKACRLKGDLKTHIQNVHKQEFRSELVVMNQQQQP